LAGQTGSLTLAPADGPDFDIPQYGVRHLPRLRITVASPGGGGFGDPMHRDPQAVLCDVRDGIVSPAKARAVYGVQLTSDLRRIDLDATAALRSTSRQKINIEPVGFGSESIAAR
jgi:N-methylhydantoinase B